MKYSRSFLQKVYTRIVNSMSGLADIRVEVHEKVCPHFDSRGKVVRMPEKIQYADDEEESFKFGKGICVHESSHVLFAPESYTTAVKLSKEFSPQEIQDFLDWLNVFCDANNEYKVTEIYPHLKQPLIDKTEGFIEHHPETLKTDNPFIQVLMRIGLADLKAEFPDKFPEKVKKFIIKWTDRWNKNNLKSAKGSVILKESVKIFREWMKIKEDLAKFDQEKAKQLMKDLAKAIEEGDEEAQAELEKAIKEATKKEEIKDPIERRLLPQSEAKRNGNSQPGQPDYSELSLDELKKMLKEKREKEEGKEKFKLQGGWGNDWIEEIPFFKRKRPEEDPYEIDLNKPYKIGKEINRILKRKITLLEDYRVRQRSGRIDFEEIRTQVGKMGRIYKPTLFQRPEDYRRGGEWAISVLCDCSGSMGGYKMERAKEALATLAYALDGLPNVHYELTGFTTEDNYTLDLIVKEYSERKLRMEYLQRLTSQAGNQDGFNLREAVRRMNKFQNIKRLIIVISDGQPAYNYKGVDGIEDMHRLVKQIEDKGIKIIGIGIEGATQKSLEYIYPNHFWFKDSSKLALNLATLILEAIRPENQKKRLVKSKYSMK